MLLSDSVWLFRPFIISLIGQISLQSYPFILTLASLLVIPSFFSSFLQWRCVCIHQHTQKSYFCSLPFYFFLDSLHQYPPSRILHLPQGHMLIFLHPRSARWKHNWERSKHEALLSKRACVRLVPFAEIEDRFSSTGPSPLGRIAHVCECVCALFCCCWWRFFSPQFPFNLTSAGTGYGWCFVMMPPYTRTHSPRACVCKAWINVFALPLCAIRRFCSREKIYSAALKLNQIHRMSGRTFRIHFTYLNAEINVTMPYFLGTHTHTRTLWSWLMIT